MVVKNTGHAWNMEWEMLRTAEPEPWGDLEPSIYIDRSTNGMSENVFKVT